MEIRELVQAQKAFYDAGVTKNIETRLDALLKLYVALSKNEATLTDALHPAHKTSLS